MHSLATITQTRQTIIEGRLSDRGKAAAPAQRPFTRAVRAAMHWDLGATGTPRSEKIAVFHSSS